MSRLHVRLLGAPSNLGLAPYPSGEPRRVDEAPAVLRAAGLVERLGAEDLGDVVAPAYRDLARGTLPIRNAPSIADYSAALGDAVRRGLTRDGAPSRLLVVGGDCSVILGALLGARAACAGAPVALAFIDAHCDFATPAISHTGGAAGMDLALSVGAFEHPLAALRGDGPLVAMEHVALLGRKDLADEPAYGEHSVHHTPILDLPCEEVQQGGVAQAVERALARVVGDSTAGFWIHLDTDVLPPDFFPAVDSPEAGGLVADELIALLRALLAHPAALGMDVTIYDPGLDPDRSCAFRLVELLSAVFAA